MLKQLEKIQNMANFIKTQSHELLHKLTQYPYDMDEEILKKVEQLCDVADDVRAQIGALKDSQSI